MIEKLERVVVFRNLLFVISGAAYLALVVPAEGKWLIMGAMLIVFLYGITRFCMPIKDFVNKNKEKHYLIFSTFFSLLLGFRFEKVWRYSSKILSITSQMQIDSSVLLYVIGIILGFLGIYFFFTVLIFLLKFPRIYIQRIGLVSGDREKRVAFDKKFAIGIMLVLLFQIMLLVYWGIQKQGYHVDEVYTFELSNYQYTNYGDISGSYGQWKSGKELGDVIEPNGSELFNLTIPYWNSETDNHPLTYYTIVHILSSTFHILKIGVNKWVGLLPNIAFCLVTTFFLIISMYRLLQKKCLALVGGAIWAFSIGTINTGIYLRMYALLTMWCIIFTYLHLELYKKVKRNTLNKNYILTLEICTMAGILSQYYFLIFAFLTCAITFAYFLIKKNWKYLTIYIITEFSAVFLAILLFPRMIVRLFFGDRGVEALNNASSNDRYAEKIKSVSNAINNEIFNGWGIYILTVCLGIIVTWLIYRTIIVKKSKNANISLYEGFVTQFSVVSVLFVIIIAKIAPYMSDRYFMCVFPIIVMCVAYIVFRGITFTLHRLQVGYFITVAIVCVLMTVMTITSYHTQNVKYVYADQVQRRVDIEAYGDIPVYNGIVI